MEIEGVSHIQKSEPEILGLRLQGGTRWLGRVIGASSRHHLTGTPGHMFAHRTHGMFLVGQDCQESPKRMLGA